MPNAWWIPGVRHFMWDSSRVPARVCWHVRCWLLWRYDNTGREIPCFEIPCVLIWIRILNLFPTIGSSDSRQRLFCMQSTIKMMLNIVRIIFLSIDFAKIVIIFVISKFFNRLFFICLPQFQEMRQTFAEDPESLYLCSAVNDWLWRNTFLTW